VWEFLPGHHLQNLWGFVPQHRLVAEDKIGRRLLPNETVHHEDEIKTNNDPANLKVMTQTEHRRYHAQKMGWDSRKNLPRQTVIEALQGRSIKNAARHLGCDPQTLRNRFPELIRPRQRKTPVKIDLKTIDKLLKDALNPQVSVKDCMKRLGVGYVTINRYCKRNGVKWTGKQPVRRGEVREHYRGKPTRKWLELNGSNPEPVTQ
jgi:hypothetical protein